MSDRAAHPQTHADTPFPNTRWSLVLQAQGHDRQLAERALEELCRDYWRPAYAWLRRRGFNKADAEDITQGFFQKILFEETFQFARRDRGRLRTFLLTALQRYVADDARHRGAQKRGGAAVVVRLDDAEEARLVESLSSPGADPESCFHKAWAASLLDKVLHRLADAFRRAEKEELFKHLREYLEWNETDTPYGAVAARLNMSETAVRLQVFRMRHRYRKLLEEEIAQTVATASEVEEELSFLMKVLRD